MKRGVSKHAASLQHQINYTETHGIKRVNPNATQYSWSDKINLRQTLQLYFHSIDFI
jgi:hypothetical protein